MLLNYRELPKIDSQSSSALKLHHWFPNLPVLWYPSFATVSSSRFSQAPLFCTIFAKPCKSLCNPKWQHPSSWLSQTSPFGSCKNLHGDVPWHPCEFAVASSDATLHSLGTTALCYQYNSNVKFWRNCTPQFGRNTLSWSKLGLNQSLKMWSFPLWFATNCSFSQIGKKNPIFLQYSRLWFLQMTVYFSKWELLIPPLIHEGERKECMNQRLTPAHACKNKPWSVASEPGSSKYLHFIIYLNIAIILTWLDFWPQVNTAAS